MRTLRSKIYAWTCTLALACAFLLAFGYAWNCGTDAVIELLVGFVVGFAVAPTLHELGHVVMAKSANMQISYAKFFCVKIGANGVGLASPFAPDETQVVPKTGGNMQARATRYTLGGLLFGGVWLVVLIAVNVVCALLGKTSFACLGLLPYSAYLFLLNFPPLSYPSGKTDTLVYRGILRGEDAEKNMLAAMEIQGGLYEGKSFTEMDEALYFSQPQLCEDEPLFAITLDLRYRYCLEKGELDRAADCLNRLANAQAYLPQEEVEKVAAELAYMHAVRGDLESTEACVKLCENYLRSETATARRILAACAYVGGKTEEARLLKESAENYLENELLKGVGKAERILLSRIDV